MPSDRLHTIETHIDNLNEMIQALRAQWLAGSRHPGPQRPISSTQESTLSSESTSESAESSSDTSYTSYVDLAFLTSLCDEVAELGEALSNQARYLLDLEQTSPTEAESEPEYQAEADSRRPLLTQGHLFAPSSLQTGVEPRPIPVSRRAPVASAMPWDATSDVVMDQTGIDWAYFDQVLHENGHQEPDPGPQL